jgi:signal transduction histidine kinase
VRVMVDASSMSSLNENVMCDQLLERVFFSLLSNAVKFSPQNGIVVVTITFDTKSSESTTQMNPKDGDIETLETYTFHFRNSTVVPMRLAEVVTLLIRISSSLMSLSNTTRLPRHFFLY